MDSSTGGRSADSKDDVIKNLYINYIIMASGTGNSFIHHGSVTSSNASLLSAAYPHGMPSGMNLPISQLESVGGTPPATPYTFASMGGGRRRLNKSKSKNLRKQKRRLTRSHSTSLKRRHTHRSRRYKK